MRLCRRGCSMLLATLSLSLLSAIAVIYTARKLSAGTLRTNDPSRGVNPLTSDGGIQQGAHGHRHVATYSAQIDEVQGWIVRQSHNVKRGQPAVTESHRERDSDGGSDVKRQRQVWRSGERDPDMMKLQKAFPLAPHFSFPNPQITCPLSDIDNSQWMANLRRHLSTLSGRIKVINMVTSNLQYQDVLLNWLISAVVRSGLEVDSVLVIAMERSLQARLAQRGIPSVYVPLFKLLKRDTNFTKEFDKVMMLRLAVMRLINHWGFDVHNYDTDAVLLRDPQPLYDQLITSDIISSVGRIPPDLMAQWGITICIGVVIIRSNQRTEQYWQAIPGVCLSSLDDQEKLNCGLKALNVTWENAGSNQNTTTVHGRCVNRLNVDVLPFSQICRQTHCDPEKRGSYYIWHKGGSRTRRDKLKGSRDGRTWFLRYKWSKISNDLRGRDWLDSIAYWEVTHT